MDKLIPTAAAALLLIIAALPASAQERPRIRCGMERTTPLRVQYLDEGQIVTSKPYEIPAKNYVFAPLNYQQEANAVPGATKVGNNQIARICH